MHVQYAYAVVSPAVHHEQIYVYHYTMVYMCNTVYAYCMYVYRTVYVCILYMHTYLPYASEAGEV